MIALNKDIEELKKFVLEKGEESNWNYTPNLLVKNVLIQLQYNKYKVVLFRYYKNTQSFFFTDEETEYNTLSLVEAWCSIEQ